MQQRQNVIGLGTSLKRAGIGMLLLLPTLSSSSTPASAADLLPLPFEEGAAVRIIQGYNGGTHVGDSQLALDLVLANGLSSGAPALSPIEGTIAWAFEPGTQTGCAQITARDGSFGVMLCHIVLDRPYARGERINRGQVLGTIGAAGEVGNNGTPHIHLQLQKGGRTNQPVPFAAPDGLPLEGTDLPATGGRNENAGGVLTSTNGVSAPPPPTPAPTPAPRPSTTPNTRPSAAPTPTPARPGGAAAPAPARPGAARPTAPAPAAQPAANRCPAGQAPTFVAGFADLKIQLGDAVGEPSTCEFPDPNGTGDVLQQTSKGLAFWRKATNTPTFTNGFDHWGRTPQGWVAWTGTAIDPPSDAR